MAWKSHVQILHGDAEHKEEWVCMSTGSSNADSGVPGR